MLTFSPNNRPIYEFKSKYPDCLLIKEKEGILNMQIDKYTIKMRLYRTEDGRYLLNLHYFGRWEEHAFEIDIETARAFTSFGNFKKIESGYCCEN